MTGRIPLILPVVLLACLPLGARSALAAGAGTIGVMTQNEYLGADLTPIITAQTAEEFFVEAAAALAQVAANDFPKRARALASDVSLTRPDVIGLQEVFDFELNGANGAPPFVDHLTETLQALAARGLPYVAAATVTHLDVTLPLDVDGDGVFDLVHIRDRDVILVRKGLSFQKLAGDYRAGGLCGVPVRDPGPVPPLPAVFDSTPSDDGCNFTIAAQVSSPLGPVRVERGFVGIDLTVAGRIYRVVDTHLEVRQPAPSNPISAIVQSLQAAELAGTLAATVPPRRPLLLLGDINSSPEDLPLGPIVPPYQVFLAAGYADAWSRNPLRILDPNGFSCCQLPDLSNRRTLLDERIDMVFVKNVRSFLPLGVVTGRVPIFPLSQPPNWGSDHGGVFDKLFVQP